MERQNLEINQICVRKVVSVPALFFTCFGGGDHMDISYWVIPASFLLGPENAKSLPGVNHRTGDALLESSKTTLERYMEQHQFLETDKKKVWDFLKRSHATEAYMARTELRYKDIFGIPSAIPRSILGIQDNFHRA